MKYFTIVAAIIAGLSSVVVSAEIQFHLAYRRPAEGAVPATFSNDSFFKSVSVEPLIRAKDLTKAKALQAQGRVVVEIEMSASARKKFNELAAQNFRNQEKGSFDDHIGLGVMIDGKPTQVIQGVFQPLSGNKMWWSPADDRLPQAEQLRISQDVAAQIMSGSNKPPVARPSNGKSEAAKK